MLKVPASEFQRNIGKYQDIALTQPVAVTRNGRVRTVLVSADKYAAFERPYDSTRVIELLKNEVTRLKAKGVAALYLFGSVARGEAGPDSDIDFFIDPNNENFSLFELAGVQLLLEDVFNKTVDVTTRDSLNPKLRSKIEESAIRIF